MGRPATHTPEALLDAAVGLFAGGGARAVTMAAVARAAGAPSGSVYHRFPDRPALLAALWLRVVETFGDAYLRRLGEAPSPQDVVETAAWAVSWCRDHPGEAAALNAGRGAFSPEQWSAEATDALRTSERARDRAIGARLSAAARAARRPVDEVVFAAVDLPVSVVRRHLPGEVPPEAVDLTRRLASRIVLDAGDG